MHNVTLRLRRGLSRKTDTERSARIDGYFVRFYAIRAGQAVAHSYARGGMEGPLGREPVGYGLRVEDAEGIELYCHEERERGFIEALYVSAICDLAGFLRSVSR